MVKITFGIIAYNEADLIHQQLVNLYPHAHEIIVVTGRVIEFGDKFPKGPDNTVKIIQSFPDPDNKITLVNQDTWPGKDRMVQEYYARAAGDYVWHIDTDEFYSDTCIENTRKYIGKTLIDNYAHEEYYYYRYYNVIVAKNGTVKFWNWPARIHKKYPNGRLMHRPQLLNGHDITHIHNIPKDVGIRHHYSIMDLTKTKMKAQFYGLGLHAKYFHTYHKPIHGLINNKVCVRPDNNKKENSYPYVLKPGELEIPNGADKLFDYYEHAQFPWTARRRKKILVVVDDGFYDVTTVTSEELKKMTVGMDETVISVTATPSVLPGTQYGSFAEIK